MKNKFQIAKWLAALSLCAALAAPSFAQQHQRGNGGQGQNRPPKQAPAAHPQQRPAQRDNRGRPPQMHAENRPNESNRANGEARAEGPNRTPGGEARPSNPNRPPNAYTPPPRTLTPQERRRNEQQFNSLAPQQKQEMRDRAQAWGRLTPEQQGHIKNDVAPKYQQLPPDRQRAIRSRLNVLKNMPESARNQHLNDPNFTRGMSEEDKAMLRDLAHMHVGGAPEAPPNE